MITRYDPSQTLQNKTHQRTENGTSSPFELNITQSRAKIQRLLIAAALYVPSTTENQPESPFHQSAVHTTKMTSKGTILGLVAIIVVCNGQREAPKKCCFDEDQFETFYGGNVAFVQDGTPIAMSDFQQMAIDVTGQRIGINGTHHFYKGGTIKIKTIQLFKEGKEYTIMNKTCTVKPLTKESGPKKCIPDDAKFSDYLDLGKHEFMTESWGINSTAQGMQGNTYVSVSSKTCAPLGANFNGVVESGGKQMPITANGGYFNISSGIKDPKKWFTVPSFCPHNVTDTQFGRENLDIENAIADFLVKIATHVFRLN